MQKDPNSNPVVYYVSMAVSLIIIAWGVIHPTQFIDNMSLFMKSINEKFAMFYNYINNSISRISIWTK